jgi:glucose/arabinose dehydrogenase
MSKCNRTQVVHADVRLRERTVAKHFIVRALPRQRIQHADFEVDGALLFLKDEKLLLDLRVCVQRDKRQA